jgi:predicted nucleic acid-binding protein
LFDSSVYIQALRQGDTALVALRRLVSGAKLWLSAVVLEELYAGAAGFSLAPVERMERDFRRCRRILVPNAGDWASTGRVLSRLAARHGYERIGRGRLTNDALIAVSAGRAGATILTANRRDFALLQQFCSFQWMGMGL